MGSFGHNLRHILNLGTDAPPRRLVGHLIGRGVSGSFVVAIIGSTCQILTANTGPSRPTNLALLLAEGAMQTIPYWAWIAPSYVAFRLGQAYMTRNRSL